MFYLRLKKIWPVLLIALTVVAVALLYSPRIVGVGAKTSLQAFVGFELVTIFLGFIFFPQINNQLQKLYEEYPIWGALRHNDVVALRYDLENRRGQVKKLINRVGENNQTPLLAAVRLNNPHLVNELLKAGADANKLSDKKTLPLDEAARLGMEEIYGLLKDKTNLSHERLKQAKTSLVHLWSFEGHPELEKILTSDNVRSLARDQFEPMHYAVLGRGDSVTLSYLIKKGASPERIMTLSERMARAFNIPAGPISASLFLLKRNRISAVRFLISQKASLVTPRGEPTALMIACGMGLFDFILGEQNFFEGTWSLKDKNGKTALDYAITSGNQNLVNLITAKVNNTPFQAAASVAASTGNSFVTSNASGNVPVNNASVNNLSANNSFDSSQLEQDIEMALWGLPKLGRFCRFLAQEIADYQKNRRQESSGLMIYGDSRAELTRFAQQLAGQIEGFQKLQINDFQTMYFDVSVGLPDLEKAVSELKGKGLFVLDGVDTALDPDESYLQVAEQKIMRSTLLKKFDQKKIIWIFTGTFQSQRQNGDLYEQHLENVFGPELGSRISKFEMVKEKWTQENLLQAFLPSLESTTEFSYEDSALALLLYHALQERNPLAWLTKAHNDFKLSVPHGQQPSFVVNEVYARNYLEQSK